MKNINKLFATLILIVAFSFNSAYSQTESITIKSTGQLRIFSGGKLKLNADQGKFRTTGTGSVVSNQGEIQFNGTDNTFTYNTDEVCDDDVNPDSPTDPLALGSSATNRVPGLVAYAATNATQVQNVQARFYENLTMADASDKSIPDAVFVYGEYLAPGSGSRTYAGTFTYDGDVNSDQTILGETAGAAGAYNDVVFQGAGVKTLADATTADMANLTIDALTGNVVINGSLNVTDAMTQPADQTVLITDGTVTLGSGASVLAGTVTISGADGTNMGSLNLNGGSTATLALDGAVNVNDFGNLNIIDGSATVGPDGSIALGDFADAKISVAALQTLTVTGSMTNAHAAGVNTDFDDASTVVYNGDATQIVMATTEANPYGNLTISGVDEKSAIGTVAASGNFTLTDANFDLGNCDPSNLAFLWLTDQTATATYGDGITLSGFEVTGRVRRTIGGATTDLTFNNYATKVAIEDNPANVNWVELCVNPGATDYVTGYDANRDVKRTIKYGYDVVSASTDWAAAISYGYKPGELETAMQDANFQKSFRFREITSSTTEEKVSTNEAITRDIDAGNANPFNIARLAAIRPTGGAQAPQTVLAEVADDNLLFLRGGPTEFISIADGRWSNPETWDEGEQPGPEDIAKIRTNVHIGFNRAGVDGTQPEEDTHINNNFGPTYTDRSTLISKIIINDDFGGTFDSQKATLIIGGTTQVGITKLTDPALTAIIPDSGTLLVKNATNKVLLADLAALQTEQSALPTSNKVDYNHGVIMLENSKLLARNNICVEGVFNGAGEVNVGEED